MALGSRSIILPTFQAQEELVGQDISNETIRLCALKWVKSKTLWPVPQDNLLTRHLLDIWDHIRRRQMLPSSIFDRNSIQRHLIIYTITCGSLPGKKEIILSLFTSMFLKGGKSSLRRMLVWHLVWHNETVYIKPIPVCLMNYTFWMKFIVSPTSPAGSPVPVTSLSDICRLILGFLRSYAYLIRHCSDFIIAQQTNLVPANITFLQFEAFIGPYRDIPDEVVAKR